MNRPVGTEVGPGNNYDDGSGAGPVLSVYFHLKHGKVVEQQGEGGQWQVHCLEKHNMVPALYRTLKLILPNYQGDNTCLVSHLPKLGTQSNTKQEQGWIDIPHEVDHLVCI
jgi:hypothetical protein